MKLLFKFSHFSICNFFLIVLLLRLNELFVSSLDLYITQLFFVINALCGMVLIRRTFKNSMDYLVIIFIIYNILNGIIIDYPHHQFLFYKAFICELSAIFFYFIGRNVDWNIIEVLTKTKYPLLFAAFCGICSFFIMPSWYLNMKSAMLEDSSGYEGAIGETFRLSSFWGHPYQLGYAIAIFSSYSIMNCFNNPKKKYYIIISTFLFLVLILCQLRVCILFYTLVFIYQFIINRKENFFIKISKLSAVVILFLIIVYYLFDFLSPEQLDYITTHTDQLLKSGAVDDRLAYTKMGLNNDIFDSFFGYGVGHFSQNARVFNIPALVDCEYQKKLAELGFFGFSIFIMIIIGAILKILNNFKDNTCANSIVLFYVIASIGASCISNVHQYPYMFWFALGYLSNNNNSLMKNENVYE